MITGLFDLQLRLAEIDRNGDPLVQLNQLVDWEIFRAAVEQMREDWRGAPRRSAAGRKPWDAVVMVKIVVLQALYNLSDHQMERQLLDRLSFMRFVGLGLGERVPDEKTIWLFKEQLTQSGLAEELFVTFEAFLAEHGFRARRGQIVDASIVAVPKQRNPRAENEQIKAGEVPADWPAAKRRQKDVDARWTKRHGRSMFGYKNHVAVDVEHKLIRAYAVTDAAVHDSRVFDELLDHGNTSRDVWADSAYQSQAILERLDALGFRAHVQRKGHRNRPLPAREQRGNRTRARIRARVEHVFGAQRQKMGQTLLRSIGIVRAACRLGLRNLAYNIDRFVMLRKRAAAGSPAKPPTRERNRLGYRTAARHPRAAPAT